MWNGPFKSFEPSLGILYVWIPENERHLLGFDGDGPHGTASSHEQRGNPGVYQVVPAWVWGHKCEHWARSASSLHSQCCPGRRLWLDPRGWSCDLWGGVSVNFLLREVLPTRSVMSWHVLAECQHDASQRHWDLGGDISSVYDWNWLQVKLIFVKSQRMVKSCLCLSFLDYQWFM